MRGVAHFPVRRVLAPALAVAALLCAGDVAAQVTCDLQPSPGSEAVVFNQGTPYQVAHLRRPILSCTNGMRITADSAVDTRAIAEIRFLGNVRFSDPEQRLHANFVQYLTAQRHIAAQGDVVLLDLVNGSTIRAPALDYLMASPTRPEPRIEVYSGRPRTMLVSAPRADAPGDTTYIDSDALSIIGEQSFIGRGDVWLRRGDLEGRGELLDYNQSTGTLKLAGEARLDTEEYRLAGDTVTVEVESDTLRSVLAVGAATLETDDVNVDAPLIRIGFVDGELHQLVALGGDRVAADPGVARPTDVETRGAAAQARVVSPDFRMIADSIEALAPARRLERVVAIGAAFGERLPTDSLARAEADTLPDFIAHDWVRGDTIVAVFAADTTTEADAPLVPDVAVETVDAADATAQPERVLESLNVRGGEQPASSAYRVRDDNDPDAGFTINYLLAREIRVAFVGGEVKRVEAEGEIQGIYLRPTVANSIATPAGRR